MKVFKAYKTELDPNNVQRTALLKHAGVARFTYNWGLNEKKKAFALKEKTPNFIELNRRLNAIKGTEFPWMYEVSTWASQAALHNLDTAFDNFFRRCKAKETGGFKGKVGFPKFKSKHKGTGSFRLYKNIHIYDNHVQLPRLGKIKLKEHSYIPTEEIKIISATVIEKAGRWFVSVLVEQEQPPALSKSESVVGVDLGIKTLAVCSDGKTFDNPKALHGHLVQLRHLQQHVSRKVKGSKNRKKAVRKVSRLHLHIANVRKDCLHKITSELTKTKSVVVIEDLNVAGMMKNEHLSQSIQDLGLGEFRRQMEYKGLWYGCQVVIADRFFPSSKLCSACGCVNNSLTLVDREWKCSSCGVQHNRDQNAAKNLEEYGRKVVASSVKTLNSPMEKEALTAA